MTRTILVSNRLPVAVRQIGDQTVITQASGGLGATLDFVHRQGNSLWFGSGSTGITAEQLRPRGLVVVDLPREVARRHNDCYSNQVIWPLFHYRPDLVTFESADFEGYREANRLFADAVAAQYRPGDLIWVNDYHLMLLPAMLRERLPDALIGFFLHIPFPEWEVFRVLARREEILRGLFGADLVCVHTAEYADHLLAALRQVLDLEIDDDGVCDDGRHRARVMCLPLGIDVAAAEERARRPEVAEHIERLRQRYAGRKIIFGVERLDYTKGLPLRLRAYRHLLDREPRWRREAVYVQLSETVRQTVPSYRDFKQEFEQLMGEVNAELTSAGAAPIEYINHWVPEDELTALLCVADICWITAVRDGLNMVAKEYIAHSMDEGGSLVLSEFTGAADELEEALIVNPWDIEASADALHRALMMDASEQMTRMKALRRRVHRDDIARWVDGFLAGLIARRS